MSFIVVAGVLFLVLSALAYVRPGRSGTAILALVAGYQLAELWAAPLAKFISHAGDTLDIPVWQELPYVALVLAPAVLLLLGKGTRSRVPRLLSAPAVGVLAVTLLAPAIASVILIDSDGRTFYDALTRYTPLIITIALVISFIDLLFTSTSKSHGHDKD